MRVVSEDNVARFREATALVNRDEWEAFVQMTHPELVFIPLRAPVQGRYLGHEGLDEFVADTRETFDVFEWHAEEIRDLGDRVLGIGTLRLRGRGSQIETEVPAPVLVTYENGLIARFQSFPDRDSALRAAGLG
jgi:hypothetical protein